MPRPSDLSLLMCFFPTLGELIRPLHGCVVTVTVLVCPAVADVGESCFFVCRDVLSNSISQLSLRGELGEHKEGAGSN